MPSHAPELRIQRARPLLGTNVSIRVEGMEERDALERIEAGFAEIADIHQLMSFHEPSSDISRLNCLAATEPVPVDRRTIAVLRQALETSTASDGVFDITIARALVDWGYLPRPDRAPDADPQASWRDITLLDDACVRFAKPLWIDLGGIAKGYAVDRAVERMALGETVQCCVNAGGDLRLTGPRAERILLRDTGSKGEDVPMIELENGSLASSSGRASSRTVASRRVGPHLNAMTHGAVGSRSFVSVAADSCMVADALSKVVLALGASASDSLRRFGATAYLHTPQKGWRILGGTA